MKLKSLILGSATVALAATGAQAADAIVFAEPEPVEYVRVCDVYGAGFFYIPGTETCLRIGGEFRYEVRTGNNGGFNYHGFAEDTWTSHSRARVYFDARSQTELGELRGYARYDMRRTNGVNDSGMNHVWVSLGGFRAGWTDSAWVHTPQGGAANYGTHADDVFFTGYQQRHLIQYNFAGSNGFFATISLEDDEQAGGNYMPDIVGVVGVNQGWGAAWLKVGFDEDRDAIDPVTLLPLDESGFGVTAGLRYNVPGAPGSSFILTGSYADSDNAFNPLRGSALWRTPVVGLGAPEWAIKASYQHQFNAQFSASLGVHYFNDFYEANSDLSTGNDGWAVEATVVWTPVENFAIRGEVLYADIDGFGALTGESNDSISGFVRFSRFF